MICRSDMEQQVLFDPIEHKYTDRAGNRLISCSQLISRLKPPFDPDGTITAKYAAKNGLTIDEVKASWKKNE